MNNLLHRYRLYAEHNVRSQPDSVNQLDGRLANIARAFNQYGGAFVPGYQAVNLSPLGRDPLIRQAELKQLFYNRKSAMRYLSKNSQWLYFSPSGASFW